MSRRVLRHLVMQLSTARLRLLRARVKRKPAPRWWLVYGPPRAGTTYMHRMVQACSVLHVSDWGLAPALNPIPEWFRIRSAEDFDYIRFDYERYLKDISRNILDNAYPGRGVQLDLVYKQATLGLSEYETLVRMWGPPERALFCIRQPAGYITSARKKFIYDTVETLQQVYIDSMSSYVHIRGDIFDYTPELTVSDYTSFLQPLSFEGKWLPPFQFKGEQDHENTTKEMWDAYHRIKELAGS
jgi:hypothetical protein